MPGLEVETELKQKRKKHKLMVGNHNMTLASSIALYSLGVAIHALKTILDKTLVLRITVKKYRNLTM